jgi:hypothetical protein
MRSRRPTTGSDHHGNARAARGLGDRVSRPAGARSHAPRPQGRDAGSWRAPGWRAAGRPVMRPPTCRLNRIPPSWRKHADSPSRRAVAPARRSTCERSSSRACCAVYVGRLRRRAPAPDALTETLGRLRWTILCGQASPHRLSRDHRDDSAVARLGDYEASSARREGGASGITTCAWGSPGHVVSAMSSWEIRIPLLGSSTVVSKAMSAS